MPSSAQPRGRRVRRRRSWAQRFILAGGTLSAVCLAGAAVTMGYVYRKAEKLPRVALSSVLTESADEGEPKNYLVIGVDFADPNDPLSVGRDGLKRSDTIMVLRVDPRKQQAELLSFPRDLWVRFPDGHNQRINTAIQEANGRPDVLIQLMQDYFGIPIHHFVQVDFGGFRDLVEAVDGVPVYFPHPARDTHSGLYVEQTGCVTLNPDQALSYARSRYFEQLVDGEWERDPTADLGRIQRQQDFIRRALDRAVDKGARNPGTLDQLIDAGLDAVAIDDDLTAGDLFDLAGRFRSFDPNALVTYSLPVVGDDVGGASVVRLVEAQAEPILARFRDVGSGEITPVSVRLSVLNGSGQAGQAEAAATGLAAAGFTVVGTGEAPSYDVAQTTIRYPEGQRAQAELLQRWLAGGAVLEEVPALTVPTDGDAGGTSTTVDGVDTTDGSAGIVLVTGADWQGVLDEPRSDAGDATTATDRTDSTDSTSSTDSTDLPGTDSTDGTSTSTTVTTGTTDDELDGRGTTTTTAPPQDC